MVGPSVWLTEALDGKRKMEDVPKVLQVTKKLREEYKLVKEHQST